jgi:hypothetical protein
MVDLRLALPICLSTLLLACSPGSPSDDTAGETGETGECPAGEPGCPCAAETLCTGAALCLDGVCEEVDSRRPFRDEWREELVLPAEGLRRLVIGGQPSQDNFANRGDIELRYVEDSADIRVELQRFTMAGDVNEAHDAFARMSLWAYARATPEPPNEAIADSACELGGADFCHLRTYYDGLIQPLRDGANIRVSLPRGWPGALELETEDNLHEGGYPDRGDILVDGLAGALHAILDSGRARVRLDPFYDDYPGCPNNDACVEQGLAPGCGCSDFGNVRIEARSGQAAQILVDAPPSLYYTVLLQNEDPILELGCSVTIDCEAFESCELDPNHVDNPAIEWASLNDPGEPALPDSGIRIDLRSGACAMIEHAEAPVDYFEGAASQVRGSVELCSGCL